MRGGGGGVEETVKNLFIQLNIFVFEYIISGPQWHQNKDDRSVTRLRVPGKLPGPELHIHKTQALV